MPDSNSDKDKGQRPSFEEMTREDLERELTTFRQRADLADKSTHAVVGVVTRIAGRLWLGPRLYQQTILALLAWRDWLRSDTRSISSLPEDETIRVIAAAVSRLLSLGLLAVLLPFIPLIPILIQTWIMNTQSVLMQQQAELMEGQNDEFERQNQFVAFEQTARFRQMLMDSALIDPSVEFPYGDLEQLEELREGLNKAEDKHWPPANRVTVETIINLGQKEPDIVMASLSPLRQDRVATVAAGAIIAMHKIQTHSFGERLNASSSNLRYADVSGTYPQLQLVNPSGAVWTPLSLTMIDLSYSDLVAARFQSVTLTGALLDGANLSGADFRGAKLDDTSLSQVLASGTNFIRASLQSANLTGAKLNNSNFLSANFSYSNLNNANFDSANLNGAVLIGADLNNTVLIGANLNNAELTEAKNWTVSQLCLAKNLSGIRPSDVRAELRETCPDRFSTNS